MRLIVVASLIGTLFLVSYVFTPPLRTVPPEELQKYAASQFLSEPAQAGQAVFTNGCSDCHGFDGRGTAEGPSLLDRAYAEDFRDVDLFHDAVEREIPAHSAIIGSASGRKPDFNQRELLGKYLREMRAFRAKEARENG